MEYFKFIDINIKELYNRYKLFFIDSYFFSIFGSLPATRLLDFRTLPPQISLELDGLPKKLPGQISRKLWNLSESKFLKKIVPGVSVFLPLSVSFNLFPCIRIYLFRNLCISRKLWNLSESKFLKKIVPGVSVFLPLSVSFNLFPCIRIYLFRNLCISLSQFVSFWCLRFSVSFFCCLCFSISRVVLVCLCLSLCVYVCRSSLFLCIILGLSVYFYVPVFVY